MHATHALSATAVQACRSDFAAQLAAYRNLIAAASKASGASLTRVDAALAAFEPGYFNSLLVALDARFARRPLDAEEADNPLAELRLLVDSLINHGGVLTPRDPISYAASRTVLRIDAGDRIALNADDFEAICAACLAAIEEGPTA